MIRRSFVFLIFLFLHFIVEGQEILASEPSFNQPKTVNDSNDNAHDIVISLLTLTPGADLYSVFGHSAIRVKDPHIGTDIVYNYGTFDFNDPDFLPKFIKGELDYFISQETYNDFIYFYDTEGRGLVEQILNLNDKQKIEIQNFLFWNMEPNNRFYRYNFIYNNCTTKLRDIINQYRDNNTHVASLTTTKGMSFRDGLHFYLDRSHQPWIKFGIDIILGSRIDKKMNNFEAQFLPEFLEEGLDNTRIKNQNFVIRKLNILPNTILPSKDSIYNPFTIFTFILIVYIGLVFSRRNISKRFVQSVDIILYTLTGLIGCILIFLWMFSLHEQSKENYNLLWAWPTHIIAVFFYWKHHKFSKFYFLLNSIIMLLTILIWSLIPQQINIAIIPIMCIMIISGIRLVKNN